MIKKAIAIWLSGMFLFFLVAAIAEEGAPEVIKFHGNPEGGSTEDIHPFAYTGQVIFQHSKHAEEYSEGCGACHHDSDMEPIEIYDSSEIYTCIDCHDGEEYIRGPIAENSYSRDDLIENRANVIHIICIDCHKVYNAQKHSIIAPEACRICHEKGPVNYHIK